MGTSRVLYISYDGLLEPLGQSQVLQYLKGLADHFEITLITFEKKKDWQDNEKRLQAENETKEAGIHWIPLRYHKAPTLPATVYDIAVGTVAAGSMCLSRKFQIVHARGYLPALIAVICKNAFGTRFIFDMRGFWPDEKADAGAWDRKGFLYRAVKKLEETFLSQADVVVSLTHAAVTTMRSFPYIESWKTLPRFEVIPTCTNLELFNDRNTETHQAERHLTLGYLGTTLRWYDFPPVLHAFARIKKCVPNARMVVLNRGEHGHIQEEIRKVPGIADSITVESVNRSSVAQRLSELDAGIFFLRRAYSVQAAAPTRLAEFLACGVPCLCNDEGGDMAEIVRQENVGVVLSSLQSDHLDLGVDQLLTLLRDKAIRERCRRAAEKYFNLKSGVRAYRAIYESLCR
jgi:glycosyltransferase involved in cell wall biosynthesis